MKIVPNKPKRKIKPTKPKKAPPKYEPISPDRQSIIDDMRRAGR